MKQSWVDELNAAGAPKCTEVQKGVACFCLEPENLLPSVRKILDLEYYLQDVSAADFQEGYLLTYHFAHFEEPGQAVFRVLISHEEPQIPSISSMYEGAIWHEQECNDFYGIVFTDHPDLKPLLLVPEENLYPLRKDTQSQKSFLDIFPGCKLVEAPPAPEGEESSGDQETAGEETPKKKGTGKAKARKGDDETAQEPGQA